MSGRQVAENSLRKIDGHRSNRDRAARDLSAATNLLGHAKRALKQAMKIRAGRSACTCAFIRLLCLSENFRFTHHHRVDPGGYAKKMLHTLNLFVAIERRGMARVILGGFWGQGTGHILRPSK